MKNKIALLILSLFLAASICNAKEISPINDKELVHLLANYELVAELGYPKTTSYSVKILKVQDFGECDGSPETCPKSNLYIIVSQYDEYPEQQVYKLSKKHNWEFDKWEQIPKHDGPEEYVVIKLHYQLPSKDKTKWWVNKTVTVKANHLTAEIKE